MFIVKYQDCHNQTWDEFIQKCPMATFLHSRQFLSYHKDRFQDESLMIYKDGKLIAIFPAARDLQDPESIVSHPGITYGGLLAPPKINAPLQIEIFKAIFEYYKQQEFKKLTYKPVPDCFKALPIQDDLYAMFFYNAQLVRRDLNCVILLAKQPFLSSDDRSAMRRRIKKAQENQIIIRDDISWLEKFWQQINAHLLDRYQTKTVHLLEEIECLLKKFPENIKLSIAIKDNKILAGTVLFIFEQAVHTQYLYVSEEGKEFFALDYLLHSAIEAARQDKKEYFSFGISNEQQGKVLNTGLYLSKVKHGGIGMVHDFYQIDLREI